MDGYRKDHRSASVVVGGGTSVGLAIVERLKASHHVHALDINAAALTRFNDQPDVTPWVIDATDQAAMADCLALIAARGPSVGVLVNTVGLSGPRAPIEAVSEADWEMTLRGSVGAAFFAIKALVPAMKAQAHGVIVNFSTASTRTGLPLRTPYVVAKYAVEGLTRNLARELGPFGIRVNAILPGAIDNERLRAIFAAKAKAEGRAIEAVEAEALRFISMRCKIDCDEIAAMVAFLASDAARHVTGQLIGVDGNAEWED